MNYKRSILLFLLILCAALALGGCKPSKKKVMSSDYYKDLKKKYDKVKKENEKLKSQVEEENNDSSDEKRAQSYLEKIARDSLVKLEIGYLEDMSSSEFLDEKAAFSFVTEIARRADKTGKYKPEDLEKNFQPGYEYILYDETNAVYEILVYRGDYVVFKDLPDAVFYACGANALGDAFLHYRNGYPDSRLLHRLADSPLASDDKDHYYENKIISQVANKIDRMEKEKTSRDRALATWKNAGKKKMEEKGKDFTFFHHGNTLKLTVYDEFLRIENMDGNASWYRGSEEDVEEIRQLFKDDWKTTKALRKSGKSKESTDKFHYDQMDTESE